MVNLLYGRRQLVLRVEACHTVQSNLIYVFSFYMREKHAWSFATQAHCWLCSHPHAHMLLCRAAFQLFGPTTCLGLLLPSARVLCSLCLTTQTLLQPNSPACPHHSGCQHNYLIFQPLLFQFCIICELAKGACTLSKQVTVLGHEGTLGNSPSNLLLSGLWAADHHALFLVIQPVFNAPHVL